ncbi:MAG: hypothetical protein KDK91_26585, partial [Gammaproteobacteria bacterium]|nr:hypothetical protein [Gammaproteobacteria bacterium]
YPLLTWYVGYTLLLIVPIVGAEAVVLYKSIAGISPLRSIGLSTVANFGSTLVGIVLLIGSFFLGGPPDTTEADLITLVLLYPLYVLSVWVEYGVARVVMRRTPKRQLLVALRTANKVSYFMLAVVCVGRIIKGLIVHGYFFTSNSVGFP